MHHILHFIGKLRKIDNDANAIISTQYHDKCSITLHCRREQKHLQEKSSCN